MILTEAQIASLAEQTLARIDAPGDAALLLEGSIAEGFGNSRSDIDFLLIVDQEADMPTMPTIFFIDGRRVEIRTRSVGQISRHLLEVAAYAGRTPRRIAGLDEHLLNRCQRFLHGYPVRGADLIRKVRENLADDVFAAVMTAWWAEYARHSVRHAIMLAALGQHDQAAVWARAGLQQAAKSWAARNGETYLEPKWLSLQLDRLAADPLVARYWATDSTGEIIRLVADLGVTGCADTPDRLVVERPREVTTWQIGDRVHLVRDRRDVFVLGTEAAGAWRRVVWGRPLSSIADQGDLVASFVRFGLIRFSWKGAAIAPRLPMAAPLGSVTPAPAMTLPILSITGAKPAHPRAIGLLPMPAQRFAAAAMALVWGNVMVENACEDLRGALDREQWRVAALAAARAVNGGLRALLCAYGVSPLPSDPELIAGLGLIPAPPPRIGELARRLSAGATPADRLLDEVTEFVTEVRHAAGGDAFPSSFDSADGWQTTLDIGYDWLRLGAYLDQQLPLDEAQDLLSSGGAQPHTKGTR